MNTNEFGFSDLKELERVEEEEYEDLKREWEAEKAFAERESNTKDGVKIQRLENYRALLAGDEKFRETHTEIEKKIAEVAKKNGYRRVVFGTIADFHEKRISGVPITAMTLVRVLKR